jgi:hypothetical protein
MKHQACGPAPVPPALNDATDAAAMHEIGFPRTLRADAWQLRENAAMREIGWERARFGTGAFRIAVRCIRHRERGRGAAS